MCRFSRSLLLPGNADTPGGPVAKEKVPFPDPKGQEEETMNPGRVGGHPTELNFRGKSHYQNQEPEAGEVQNIAPSPLSPSHAFV